MKTTNLLLGILITVLFTSCIEPKTPQEITTDFTNAFESKDWSTAKILATQRGIEQLESAEKSLLGMFDNFTILGTNLNETTPREINTVTCTEPTNSNCECIVTFKNNEKNTFRLIQQGEEWKVDFELSKTEQIINDVTDFVGDTFKEEIDAVGDAAMDVIEDGVEMIADSVKSKVGL